MTGRGGSTSERYAGLCRLAARVLSDHVKDHDPTARQADVTVEMADGRIRCTAMIDDGWEGDGAIPFWFRIEIEGASEVVLESLAGQGENADEATADAVHSLLAGVLPAIRAGLGLPWPDDQVATGQTVSLTDGHEPIAWDMYFGTPILSGSDHTDSDAIWSALDHNPPIEFLAQELTAVLHERRFHWAKALFLAFDGHEAVGDVAIDNESFPAAFERLQAFPWHIHGDVWGFRQFIFLSPSPEAPSGELLDTVRRAHEGTNQ
jgi:hypothetical protein